MSDAQNFSIIVETMKSMYENKKITISQIKSAYNKKQITLDEYNYILGKGR